MMRGRISLGMAIFMAVVLGTLPASAATKISRSSLTRFKGPAGKSNVGGPAGKSNVGGPAGESNVAFLDFYEMDASGGVVPDGAKGKLKYNQSGPRFDFLLDAQGLEPNADYTLIWSREPEVTIPNRFEIFGRGTSNGAGNLHIADSYKFNIDLLSGRILLIPSKYENPLRPVEHLEKFLFGQTPITYDDTTSELKSGAFMRPEAPSFDSLGPNAGDEAVDFTLWGFKPGNLDPVGNASQPLEKFTLSELLKNKPVVLVFGSFT